MPKKPAKTKKKRPTLRQQGTINSLKWKTPQERIDACKDLCDHLRKGYSVFCWVPADLQTIKSYLKRYPTDFAPDKVYEALREGRKMWEEMGRKGTNAKIPFFKERSWIFVMKNLFGAHVNDQLESGKSWADKQEIDQNVKIEGIKDVLKVNYANAERRRHGGK